MRFVICESGTVYERPEINVLEICPEGVFCGSVGNGQNEGVDYEDWN